MESTRREVIQLLAALGVSASALPLLASQLPERLTREHLERALAIQGADLPPDRLEIVRRALQQNLDELARVRALDIDDTVAPAVLFRAKSGRA